MKQSEKTLVALDAFAFAALKATGIPYTVTSSARELCADEADYFVNDNDALDPVIQDYISTLDDAQLEALTSGLALALEEKSESWISSDRYDIMEDYILDNYDTTTYRVSWEERTDDGQSIGSDEMYVTASLEDAIEFARTSFEEAKEEQTKRTFIVVTLTVNNDSVYSFYPADDFQATLDSFDLIKG